MWKKQRDGNWKLAIDLGISHAGPSTESLSLNKSQIKTKCRKGNENDFKAELMSKENFIESFSKKISATYRSNLSREARILRRGYTPFTDEASIGQAIKNFYQTKYTLIDGGVASSGDFGFVYGTADVKVSESEIKKGAYMRIWKPWKSQS